MSLEHRWRTVICLLAAAVLVSCSDSNTTNPTTPNPTASPGMAVADLAGTYAMVQKDGHALPYAVVTAGQPTDTLFAGCLFLGPVTNPQAAAKDQQGYVNITYLYDKSAADAYTAKPTVCPPFLQAASQAYQWSGSSGQWWFCGAHACSYTTFTAALVNGKLVISTGDPGSETRYAKQ